MTFFVTPAFATQDIETLQGQLQTLLERLQALQAEQRSGTSQPLTPPDDTNPRLTRDFGIGSNDITTGGEVSGWQLFLVRQNKGPNARALGNLFIQGITRGYFGRLTGEATVEWQNAMGITGAYPRVGTKTRSKVINARNAPQLVRIVTPNGNETLRIGETYQVSWTGPDIIPSSYRLQMALWGTTGGEIILPSNGTTVAQNKTYAWKIDSVVSYPAEAPVSTPIIPGSYKLKLVLYDGPRCIFCPPPYPTAIGEDESDTTFRIVAANALPLISSINPASGLIGTEVTITGQGFSANNMILFSPTAPTCSNSIQAHSSNNTTITFTVPAQSDPCSPGQPLLPGGVPYPTIPGAYRIQVFSATGSSNSIDFTVRASLTPPSGY